MLSSWGGLVVWIHGDLPLALNLPVSHSNAILHVSHSNAISSEPREAHRCREGSCPDGAQHPCRAPTSSAC